MDENRDESDDFMRDFADEDTFESSTSETDEDLAERVEGLLGSDDNNREIRDLYDDIDDLQKENQNVRDQLEKLQKETRSNRNLIDDRIEDVREKIILLADRQKERAEKDHQHPEIVSEIESEIGEIKDQLKKDISEIEKQQNQIHKKIDDRLDEIVGKESDLRGKATKLAQSHLHLRKRVDQMQEQIEEEDENLNRLIHLAQKESVTEAKCENCESDVNISLLRSSECPFCESVFTDLETHWIRSNYLITASDD